MPAPASQVADKLVHVTAQFGCWNSFGSVSGRSNIVTASRQQTVVNPALTTAYLDLLLFQQNTNNFFNRRVHRSLISDVIEFIKEGLLLLLRQIKLVIIIVATLDFRTL